MKKLVSNMAMLVISVVCSFVYAQEKHIELEEVVISATKFALKKEHTGKVIYKITQKEIKKQAGKSVIDLLNLLPGIEIKGANSNQGEIRGTYIRGGRSRQVLVLIDGVPVSDPTGVSQEYDLRMLSLNQIESIEVLKGASSALYGSGAATGVINITLKKSYKNQISAHYEASLGTNGDSKISNTTLVDRNQNVSIHGKLDAFSYLAYVNVSGVNGMSSAKSNTTQLFTDDFSDAKNTMFKLGYQINKKLTIESFLNYDILNYTYDAGAYTDSESNKGDQNQLRFGVKSTFNYGKGEMYLLASMNNLKRNLHSFNSFSSSINKFSFEGESVQIDLVNKLSLGEGSFQLISGINYQHHTNNTQSDFGNIDKEVAKFNVIDPYASLVYISDIGVNASVAMRYNMHSEYGNHLVYDTNLSYTVMNNDVTKLSMISSYGTSFIAPSIYQLFSQYGSLELNPETNATFEVGFEANYKNYLDIHVVYFNRLEENAIVFKDLFTAPWGVYGNNEETVAVEGIESEFMIQPADRFRFKFGYTYINKDNNTDYIPKNKLVANFEFETYSNLFVSLVYKNVGERTYFDQWGSFGTSESDVFLPSYSLLDVNANYKLINNNVTLFATVHNLFNEDYEETLGYATRGRNYKIGIRLDF